jgi:hypothetical protein
MASLLGRLIGWFAEEVIVKTLSRSRRFQQFALRTDNFLNEQKKTVTAKASSTAGGFFQNLRKAVQDEISAANTNTAVTTTKTATSTTTTSNTANTANTAPKKPPVNNNRIDRVY